MCVSTPKQMRGYKPYSATNHPSDPFSTYQPPLVSAPASTFSNPYHTLHALLSPQSATWHHYHLRKCTHDRQLPAHRGHLLDKNCVTRALYKDIYWKPSCLQRYRAYIVNLTCDCLHCFQLLCQFLTKNMMMMMILLNVVSLLTSKCFQFCHCCICKLVVHM